MRQLISAVALVACAAVTAWAANDRATFILTNGQRNLLSEIETADTYASTHTRDQLSAFDSTSNYLLEVVVPESVYDVARMLCAGWGISVDSWRTFKD